MVLILFVACVIEDSQVSENLVKIFCLEKIDGIKTVLLLKQLF